jgi:hypothetical protein
MSPFFLYLSNTAIIRSNFRHFLKLIIRMFYNTEKYFQYYNILYFYERQYLLKIFYRSSILEILVQTFTTYLAPF